MKGSDKTDHDFKVGISNEDRIINTEQRGSSPVGTGEARLLFFCYFFYCKYMETETNFNKTLLSSVPVLFTL